GVVLVQVAVAGVADQGDDTAPGALGDHFGDQFERAPQPGPGGPARLAPDGPLQGAYGRDARRVRDLHHPVDRAGHEARFHARPADAFDAGAAVAGGVRVVMGPAVEETGVLRVGH